MSELEEFWDGKAERYAAQPISDVAAYEAKLEATRAHLKADDVVLDVGCGTGTLALALSPSVGHVHGIDLSKEMVAIANRKRAEQRVENVTFRKATLDDEPFPSGLFDAVCAYNILHLLPDRRGSLRALYELLKPGGILISSTPCLRDSWVPFRLVLPVMRLVGKAPPVQVFGVRELKSDLEHAGFADVSEENVSSGRMTAFLIAARPSA